MFIAHKTVFIIRPCTKALYTLVTKSIVAEAANKSATKSTVAHMVNFVADTVDFVTYCKSFFTMLMVATNRQQLEFDSLSR